MYSRNHSIRIREGLGIRGVGVEVNLHRDQHFKINPVISSEQHEKAGFRFFEFNGRSIFLKGIYNLKVDVGTIDYTTENT